MAASINIKVNSDFAQASADLKEFGAVTEVQRKKIEKFTQSFKTEQLDAFEDRTRRNTAAIKAARGPVDALQSEYKSYQRQIESLIKRGMDPEDDALKGLKKRYAELEQQVKETTAAKAKSQKQTERNEKALTALKFGAIAAGLALGRMFIDFSKESAQAASDAEEIEGKFSVVFRSIGDEAAEAAATIADDFDLAASTVNKLLGDTGDILTGLGFSPEKALELSESVATLGLDLASFTNFAGGAEGASAALTKALLGEAESVKALGIVIRQDTVEYKELVAGIMEVEKVGLVQAKALAALQIATEQSKNSIGDYARTSESAANVQKTLAEQTKRLKEEYGEMVLQGITPARAALRGLFSDIADNISAVNTFRGVLKDVGDGILDEEKSIEDLRMSLEKLEKLNRSASGQGRFKEEIATLKVLIDTHGMYDTFLQKEEGQKEANIRAEKDLAQAQADRLALGLSAATELEARQQAALSSDEKQLASIQAQINEWLIYSETVPEAMALVNQLALERNAILDEQAEKVAELAAKEQEIAEAEAVAEQEKQDAAIASHIEFLKAKTDASREAQEAGKELRDKEAKQEAEAEKARQELLVNTVKAYSGMFGAIGELITAFAGKNREAAITAKALAMAQAGINSALAFTQTIADPTLPLFLKIPAAIGIAAAGIAQQINIANTPIPTAQTGTGSAGLANTAGLGQDTQPLMIGPGETANVSPRGEGGRTQNISVDLNGEAIIQFINDKIESQDIRISVDNIQGGAATA